MLIEIPRATSKIPLFVEIDDEPISEEDAAWHMEQFIKFLADNMHYFKKHNDKKKKNKGQ